MGGSLTASSRGLGTGTTFEFTIPLRRVPEPGAAPAPARSDDPVRVQLLRFSHASMSAAAVEAAAAEPALVKAAATSSAGAAGAPDASDAADEAGPSTPPADSGEPELRALVAEDDRLSQALMVRPLRHACRCGPGWLSP
jgi:hypothetical protein